MSAYSTLYHGSVFLFDKIDVSMGKPYKDFGSERGVLLLKPIGRAAI